VTTIQTTATRGQTTEKLDQDPARKRLVYLILPVRPDATVFRQIVAAAGHRGSELRNTSLLKGETMEIQLISLTYTIAGTDTLAQELLTNGTIDSQLGKLELVNVLTCQYS
jgi:hypothetical protein